MFFVLGWGWLAQKINNLNPRILFSPFVFLICGGSPLGGVCFDGFFSG